ncbi:hypothetical protein [Streptomyces sp. NPDC087300]|uniref:hypothetical protein n=1 Tax=Streptomyces sp. NPDC087300 TaxID=3365780 RepID=UPI0037FE0942
MTPSPAEPSTTTVDGFAASARPPRRAALLGERGYRLPLFQLAEEVPYDITRILKER